MKMMMEHLSLATDLMWMLMALLMLELAFELMLDKMTMTLPVAIDPYPYYELRPRVFLLTLPRVWLSGFENYER